MRLVHLRTFVGVPGEGEPVFVAPDNVGMVTPSLPDPPTCEVWLKVGPPMLVVEGSAERVAAMVDAALADRTDAPSRGLDDSRLVDFRGPPPPSQRCSRRD